MKNIDDMLSTCSKNIKDEKLPFNIAKSSSTMRAPLKYTSILHH